MSEQKYRSELRRAEAMKKLEPARVSYWDGYGIGLRRFFLGEIFVTSEEHEKWLCLVASKNKKDQQRGQGYQDGILYGKISSKIGRPSVGAVTLPAITIEKELESKLKKKAEEFELSMAETRRMSYAQFCKIDKGDK